MLITPRSGVVGCVLHVAPNLLSADLTLTGSASFAVAVSNSPAIAGSTFYLQVIAVELDVSCMFTAITSTNALAATLGSF
ncbi:MAG: hypothetical protein ACI9SE_002771 [Neolewinella sp.]|jgi:hypothetical protein